jgi:hypothetical protein
MFRVGTDGTVEKKPVREEQVGSSFGGSYSFDLNAMGVTIEGNSTSTSKPIIVVARGCHKRSCEDKQEREILFCSNNRRRIFVSNEIRKDEDWVKFDEFLGIQNDALDPTMFSLTSTSANATTAGLVLGQKFLTWKIAVKDTTRAALSGIQTGDLLFSIRGRTAVTWYDLQCSLMDGNDEYGEVSKAFQIAVLRNNNIVILTFRPE